MHREEDTVAIHSHLTDLELVVLTVEKPRIYEGMGVREYAIFAPERRDGPQLFGYRRDAAGRWVPWHADSRGILWSQELGGLGLYAEDRLWLRALDAEGNRLPTPRELVEEQAAAYRDAERDRAAEAARREAAELPAAAAEAEAARLREKLRRLRGE